MRRIRAIFQHKKNRELFDAMGFPEGTEFSDDLVEDTCVGILEAKYDHYTKYANNVLEYFKDDPFIDAQIEEAESELATLNADELRVAANHHWEDTF